MLCSSRRTPRDTYHTVEDHEDFFVDWLHSVYFRPRPDEDYGNVPSRFLLEPASHCTNMTFMIILIESLPSEAPRRRLVRSTWGQAAITRMWHAHRIHEELQLFFILGRPQNETELQAVQDEAGRHDDIVMVDMEDVYRNLTSKTLAGLLWTSLNCPGARYVVKADQDTFVHVPRLMTLLRGNEAVFKESLLGEVMHSPLVKRLGKYGLSFKEYLLPWYASYANGPLYVLDNAVVDNLVRTARHLPYLPFEDVFVGSVCRVLGIRRVRVQPFLVSEKNNDTFCWFTDSASLDIGVTALSSEQIQNIWNVLERGGSLC